jgi:peptidyl-prolyl cis-trans isomerase SurA
MHSRTRGVGTARQILSAAGVLGLGLAGCANLGDEPAVRDAARPHADAILADAPALLPQVPVTTTSLTRGQTSDIQPTGGTTAGGQVAARMRASVNGIPILDDEIREAMAQYVGELMTLPEPQRSAAQQKIAQRELDRLIERELVLEEMMARLKAVNQTKVLQDLQREATKEADKRLRDIKAALKVQTDDELKALLQSQGLSVAGLRRQSERSFMMMEYIRNMIHPLVQRISLQQVREYYEEHADEFRVEDTVKWQDIFIDVSRFPDAAAARRYAEQVLARARSGADFAALAKECDHGDSHLRGGEGLGHKHGEIVPAQADAAVWSLKAGEVGPLIDLGFGFHIVRVAERQYAGRRPFDVPCQADIRKKLTNQIADREYKRIVEDLKRKATITVYQ